MRACAALFGVFFLIAGLALLFIAQAAPRFLTEQREVGGASITQQQIADQAFGTTYSAANPPDLPVSVDGEQATTNSIAAVPQIEADGLNDAPSVEMSQSSAETISQSQMALSQAAESFEAASMVRQNAALDTQTEVEVVPLELQSAPPQTSLGQGGAGAINGAEQRVVELEWPSSFRVGGSASVRLTLRTLADGGLVAVPEISDSAVLATPILLSDLYATHQPHFTARLVAPDFALEALTPATQSTERGEEATWRWSLKAPNNSGQSVLTFVLDITWIPRAGAGGAQVGPRPIWGQAIQVETNYVFGSVTVPQASALGGALSIVGFLSQVPMLWTLVEFVFGSRRRRRTTQKRSTTRRR